MISGQHTPNVRQACGITDRLVGRFSSICAIILCGSVARGDADAFSDLDLVVIGSDDSLTAKELSRGITDRQHRLSILYYTRQQFKQVLQQRPLFAIHLRTEGIVLFDRIGVQKTLAECWISPAEIDEQIKLEADKLTIYAHSERFHNNFLFCLSHLYSIGKAIVMLQLARGGVLQFNRDAAFEQFATVNPELKADISKVTRLRPFYRLVNARQPEALPFSYHSAGSQMEEAVRAIQRLARYPARS